MGSYPYDSIGKFVGLKTGSGGGGNEDWGYDVSIFLDDWPGLNQQWADMIFEQEVTRYEQEKDRIINRLKGKR